MTKQQFMQRFINDQNFKKILKMHREGHTDEEMALVLNVDKSEIRLKRNENNLKKNEYLTVKAKRDNSFMSPVVRWNRGCIACP